MNYYTASSATTSSWVLPAAYTYSYRPSEREGWGKITVEPRYDDEILDKLFVWEEINE